jgi:large subunit ribosomal protein L25
MSEAIEITAVPREVVGKANRRLASAGLIPAVLYGHDRPTKIIAVDRHDFELLMTHHAQGSTIVEIHIDGDKRPVNAVVKEVQHSPIKGNILHIDFQVIRMDEAIHVPVPLRYVGDPAGVKAGGILTENVHQVNIEAKPKDIPESLEVAVDALEIGDSLHLADVVVPQGVKILDDLDEILCSVLPPAVVVEVEVAAAEEAEEPEVVGEKSAEESEEA